MTADKVLQSPQFARLSEQQQAFVRALVDNGWDKIEAARTAYKCKDDRSATTLANRAMKNPKISALINLIDPSKSRMTRDEALQIAAQHARTATKGGDAIRCLQLIATLEGWTDEKREPEDDEKDIYAQADELEKQS